MIDTFEVTDEHDPRVALTVGGLLGEFNRAGALSSADVHVARTLGDLAGEEDERVLLAVALACAAVRGGSVCLDLAATAAEPLVPAADAETGPAPEPAPSWPEARSWAEAVAASRVVAAGLVRWEQGLVYLDRYHQQECQVRDDLVARATRSPSPDEAALEATLARVLPGPGYAEQAAAVRHAAGSWTTVLTGGPGTGKTTAVAGLLVTLAEQAAAAGRPRPRIALAAPTGKAAARLQESVVSSAAALDPGGAAGLADVHASTLHGLLRLLPGQRTRFRHDRRNRLPHDVVVVDEASMVSLTMMARLLEAVRPDARLVLVGDPDQLSSVDAGAVLTDLVAGFAGRPDDPVVSLRTTHRYGAEIGALAGALRAGDADAVVAALEAGGGPGAAGSDSSAGAAGDDAPAVVWVRDADPTSRVRAAALPAALALRDAALAGDAARAVAALDRHRLLCAHREGPSGVRRWNRQVEQWLVDETGDPLVGSAYPGRPLLVTANDHTLGVWNGDTGVVVAGPQGPRVALGTGSGVRELAPSRLADVLTMHAMTIHKSQGSQADEVTVVLPEEDSRLLSRELFYTAVTRARRTVRVVGSESAVRAAVGRQARRASGLRQRLSSASPVD